MKKEKRENYRFWHSPIALIVLFLIVILFGYNLISLIKKEKETEDKKNLVIDQINDLQKRENLFTEEISNLDTEEGKERIIREKYQVAKDGEKVLVIVDEEEKNTQPEEVKKSNGVFDWFKGIFEK